MFGQVKYIGKSVGYDFYYNGKCIQFLRDSKYHTLPIENCRELIQNSNFVPSEETYKQLRSSYFGLPELKVEGMLTGKDCFIIGAGSSLRNFDFSKLNGKFTMVLNNTFSYYQESKAVLFIDKRFLRNKEIINSLSKYNGIIFSAFRTRYFLEPTRGNRICSFTLQSLGLNEKYYEGLFNGRSSGLVALNLAIIMKPKKIYLLGYDYNYEAEVKHFYNEVGEDKFKNEKAYDKSKCRMLISYYGSFASYKDKIINCNLDSAIPYFEKKNIEEVLC